MGHPVSVGKAGVGFDVEFGVGVQAMSDPPHAHAAHADHARFTAKARFGGVDQCGSTPSSRRRNTSRTAVRSTATIATVMISPTIGSASGKPEPHADGAENHCEGGEPVGPGM